ncbi:MAG: SpoIIE family protein phosphatase [Candidatus Firestonebacteria bacterium]|nr:SpoIIE family protein phosphatase [Candidatus Firestonebacteria bacterium]
MPYLHMELDIRQSSKKGGQPCGDVVLWEKNPEATYVVVADGLGSGINANLAATFAAQRLLTLLREGMPLRAAFSSVVADSERAKQNQGPYAALLLCRIFNHGQATVLVYEMPVPLAVENQYAFVLEKQNRLNTQGQFDEITFDLKKDSALFLLSDGITQAGLGGRFTLGWRETGVAAFFNRCFQTGVKVAEMAPKIQEQAWRLDGVTQHDDMTVVRLLARAGQIVTIFSGPPESPEHDAEVVTEFLAADGIRVVCGSTTAALTARHMGRTLTMEKVSIGYVEPPRYHLPGVDVATEGAVTLNQVYNLLEETDEAPANPKSGVATLCALFKFADRINWVVGRAQNAAHQDIRFTQMGVLARLKIIPLLVEKLKAQGKLVVVRYV